MEMEFSKLFHEASKDRGRGHPPIPADPSKWPPAWRTIFYKEYPRLPKVPLPEPRLAADLRQTIINRASRRDFTASSLTAEQYSSLFKFSCGTTRDERHRAEPSGGSRFPIEAYAVVLHGNDAVPAGLYHYNVKQHALETLWKRSFSSADADSLFSYSWVKDASAVLVLTAIFARTQMKYGERGYRYILLEAGHIGQNIYLVSQALGLRCCALGGTKDGALEDIFNLDPEEESVVYAVAVGA
ncbi:MAG: SagB/ThcOx family dehydrogenase [Parcubacteria group bacterium]|nr:SagB/ThcOx family dehydrogenase [Parcubacteria group bacterium]